MTLQDIEQALRAKLEADQANDRLGHQIHLAIAEVLKTFEGKKLTKRFTDKATAAITALFPDQHPVCSWGGGPGQLSFWIHNQIPFDKRLIFYVARPFPPTEPAYQDHWIGECHAAGFEREDLYYGEAAVKRIAQRERLLNPPVKRQGCQELLLDELARKIARAQEAWKQLGDICERDEFDTLRYEAKRLSGLKEEWRGGR